MPIISAFFEIVIRMYYKEHGPAHFHAEHSEQNATFDFDGELIAGEIRSRRARERIRAWARLHRVEPAVNWEKMNGRAIARSDRAAVRGVRMTFLPSVVHAEHRGDFRLRVVFNDGSENTIDFAPWLDGPMFEALKTPAFFRRYFIDGGTVTWPNGADIAPETLYAEPGRRRPNKRLQPTTARQRSAKKSNRTAGLRS